MLNKEILQEQLLADFDELHKLILRYARGEREVKQRMEQMEDAVQIKMALFDGMAQKEH